MKKRSNVTISTDSISAIIETVLLAIISIIFSDSILYQIISFIVLLVFKLIYIRLLRKKLIDKVVSPNGMDTDLILATNSAKNLRGKVVAQVYEIQESTGSNAFEEYVAFLKWQESATFVTQHFWNNALINVVLDESARYSKNKVYKKELLQIVQILINAYDRYNHFTASVDLYACQTLSREIRETNDKLIEIEKKLKN